MTKVKRSATTDAADILHRELIEGYPDRVEFLQKAREQNYIASEIYRLRTEAGLSQSALADLVGTTTSVISRLESANYTGHSRRTMERIAGALGYTVRPVFVRTESASRTRAKPTRARIKKKTSPARRKKSTASTR